MMRLNLFGHRVQVRAKRCSAYVLLCVKPIAIVSILMVGLFLASSCALPWETNHSKENDQTPVIGTSSDTLDQQSYVRELVTCISDPTQIELVYQAIPPEQLDGLSLASFKAYILSLTYFQNEPGNVKTFRIISNQDRDAILSDISQNAQPFEDLIGVTIPVELTFFNESTTSGPVYIYFQADENGTPYLSHIWVESCFDIYDYAFLYFRALEEQNEDAVASIINHSQIPEEGEYSDAVIQYKAKELGKFYHVMVKSAYSEYRIISYDISQLTYLQPEVLNEITFSNQSRFVRFVRDPHNNIAIKDSVSDPLSSKDFYLYFKDEKAIRIGDRADSKQFFDLFGDPVRISLGELATAETNAGVTGQPGAYTPPDATTVENTSKSERNIVLTYSGASVTIRGNVYDDGSWDGQIIRIRLRSVNPDFYLGSSIHSGMTRDELLLAYPFADQTDYVLSTTIDDQKYEMTFSFAEDGTNTISGVKIELVNS